VQEGARPGNRVAGRIPVSCVEATLDGLEGLNVDFPEEILGRSAGYTGCYEQEV
jgi:hypothetical protein